MGGISGIPKILAARQAVGLGPIFGGGGWGEASSEEHSQDWLCHTNRITAALLTSSIDDSGKRAEDS